MLSVRALSSWHYVLLIFGTLALVGIDQTQAAAIFCGEDNSTVALANRQLDAANSQNSSTIATASASGDVKQFLQSVQCTLERAKPWVDELEKGAKRLEESAKRIGVKVVNKFNGYMDRLVNSEESPIKPTISLLGRLIGAIGGELQKRTKPTESAKPCTVGILTEKDDSDDLDSTTKHVLLAGTDKPAAVEEKKVETTSNASVEHSVPTISNTEQPEYVNYIKEEQDDLDNEIGSDLHNTKCPEGFFLNTAGACEEKLN